MIKIKYNCPESAEGMSATSCGKFCTSCQQEVYDFRKNTVEEINQIKSENPEIKCGIFTQAQAKVDARTTTQNIFRLAFAAIFLLGFNASMLFGQTTAVVNDTLQKETQVVSGKIIIKGTITDYNGFAVKAQVKYFIGDDYFIIETDEEGNFEFELPEELLSQRVLLQFYSEGMEYKYITTDIIQAKCYYFHVQLGEKKRFKNKNRVLMGYF